VRAIHSSPPRDEIVLPNIIGSQQECGNRQQRLQQSDEIESFLFYYSLRWRRRPIGFPFACSPRIFWIVWQHGRSISNRPSSQYHLSPMCGHFRSVERDEYQKRCDIRNESMRRPAAILGSAIFLVIAPGTIAVYVPWTLSRWQFRPPLMGSSIFRLIGIFLIAVGLPILLDSFRRFAIQGMGTPAPVAPPSRLVVSGLYRYVRNPMYVAVVSLILGQGLLLGNTNVLIYGVAVWMGFHLFVLTYEEPALRKNFPLEYKEFCSNVPRWIPRLRPWVKGA